MIKIIPPGSWSWAFDGPQVEVVKSAHDGLRGYDLTEFVKRASHPLADWVKRNPPKPGELYVHSIALGSTENYGCFVDQTEVRMGDVSLRTISAVEVGDTVITHKGRPRKVINKFIRDYIGDVIKLNIAGQLDDIRSTPEHPYYVIRKEQVACEHDKYDRCTPKTCQNNSVCRKIGCPKSTVTYSPEWVAARDIREGDFVLIATPGYDVGRQSWKMTCGAGRLGGYYLAEGSRVDVREDGNWSTFSLSFGIHEEKTYAADAVSIVNEMISNNAYKNLKLRGPILCTRKRTATVYITSSQLATRYQKYFGQLSHGLFLSGEVFQQPLDVAAAIIGGYIDGDGHLADKDDRYTVRTVSRQLALDLQWLLTKFSVPATLCFVKSRKVNERDGYQLSFAGQYGDFLDGHCGKYRKTDVSQLKAWAFAWNGYICQPVRNVSTEMYTGKVYNLEVETDNSYVVGNGVSVHNCNRNGDGYTAAMLQLDHPTFEKHARFYRNHKNTDPSKSYGIVKKSMFNKEMGRVDLITALNVTKEAAERNGGLIAERTLDRIKSGRDVAVSQSCRVPIDICISCGNKARHRSEYCGPEHCKYGGCRDNLGRVFDDGFHLYVDNPRCTFFDLSDVSDTRGADRTAFITGKVSNAKTIGGAELAEQLNLVAPDYLLSPVTLAAMRSLRKLAAHNYVPEYVSPTWDDCVRIRSEQSYTKYASIPNLTDDYSRMEFVQELATAGVVLPPARWLSYVTGTPYEKCAEVFYGGVDVEKDFLARPDCHELLSESIAPAQNKLNAFQKWAWLVPTIKSHAAETALGAIVSMGNNSPRTKSAAQTPANISAEAKSRYLAYQGRILGSEENSPKYLLLLNECRRHNSGMTC